MISPDRIFVAALAATGLLACGGASAPEEPSSSSPPPLVEAVQVRRGSLPMEESVPGVVRARNQVTIRPEIEARVASVLVRSGEPVERGQPLVRLEDDERRERLRQAEASVRLAEAAAMAAQARVTELEARVLRSRSLATEELISAQELEVLEAQLAALRASADEAQARVEQARATADERRSALAKTVVRSPLDGHLGERRVEEGMLVDPSSVLFVAGDLDVLIVEVILSEEVLAVVDTGQTVEIERRAPTSPPIRAELSRISPFLAEESFTSLGEIDLAESGGLRPGMFVDVRILVGESASGVLVPVAALWEDPASGRRGVFVVEDAEGLEAPDAGVAESDDEARGVAFVPVGILAEGRSAAGVDGIDEEAWVVTVGQHLLAGQPGQAVEAQSSTARVRPVAWERVLALQSLQSEDLLEGFLEKQRRVAAALGAEIPESEDAVVRALDSAGSSPPGGP